MNKMIHSATEKDLSKIQVLMDLLNRERSQGFAPNNRSFHQRIKPYAKVTAVTLKKDIFIVGEIENMIVGFARGSMGRRASHTLSHFGSIDEIYVVKEQRGRGLAKCLVAALAKEFRKRGCDHLVTHTDWENGAARALYHSCGMNEATIEFWKKL